VNTGKLTCEWVDHPRQRHKIVREPVGGIMPYRQYYNVKGPLRFHTTVGNLIDEEKQYARYRARPDTPRAAIMANRGRRVRRRYTHAAGPRGARRVPRPRPRHPSPPP
jgi:hypothetical protein